LQPALRVTDGFNSQEVHAQRDVAEREGPECARDPGCRHGLEFYRCSGDGAAGHLVKHVAEQVVVVNCGRFGYGIEDWNDPDYEVDLWDLCLDLVLPYVGLRLDQIRVVYHKAANRRTTTQDGSPLPSYPHLDSDYQALYDNLTTFSTRVNQFFPNLQAAYTSSRSYGGFATTPGRGEPLSYEEGHAVNSWLANHTSVGGVWQGWGAYLWAPSCTDDVMNGGGVCYFDHDFIAGGVFPSASGKGKISFLMHHRLLLERWYRR
jgi:hypothetical protein